MRKALAAGALTCYVGATVAANWLTSHFGFVPVGFGLMASCGTYAAGLALLARDFVQDAWGRAFVLFAILAGALLSVGLSTPEIALASGIAFLVAELCDMAVYTPLRKKGWARAVLPSSFVGSLLDTVTFLWLAGFPILAGVPGQMVGKLLWATALPVAAVTAVRSVRRLVLRQSV